MLVCSNWSIGGRGFTLQTFIKLLRVTIRLVVRVIFKGSGKLELEYIGLRRKGRNVKEICGASFSTGEVVEKQKLQCLNEPNAGRWD